MNKSRCFNDAPILTPEDDSFGIDSFARALASGLVGIESPIGATVALHGPWGSGKSSAVNLVRHHLNPQVEDGKLVIIDFKCWWFRGEEALTLAFLQELNGALGKSLGDKAKQLIPRLGKTLLQAGPVLGPAVNLVTGGIGGTVASASMDFAKKFFPEGDSVESLFSQLSEALDGQQKRFLVLVDDIDRLTPDEALLVFRLVKSVGRLPNVVYLLVFDRELAEKAVAERYPSEGPHFLEKIIQASFELPLPARDNLNAAALAQIDLLCGGQCKDDQLRRFMNVFYDAVSPYLNTPRDLTRLANVMEISWPAVAGEVDVADYVALEVLRLFESKLYNCIRVNRDLVCGIKSHGDTKGGVEDFLQIVPEFENEQHAKLALQRLFPRLRNMGYSSSFLGEWEASRRVCSEKHFGTYFRLTIGEETLSASEIDELIERCADIDYVKNIFREAATSIRKNGKSKVPLLFDELNVHASRIEEAKFQPLISAIFEVADDIDRDEDADRGHLLVGNTYFRIHWLIRKLMFERTNLRGRSDIFLQACKNAQVGWLANFSYSAIEDHYPGEGKKPEPPEKCLVSEEHVAELKELAVKAIELAVTKGTLISHNRLGAILYHWKFLKDNNGSDAKQWVGERLQDDDELPMLARAFTGDVWSHGLDLFGSGLGDRVSIRSSRVVDGISDFVDVEEFRRRLESESRNTFDEEQKKHVQVFLEALQAGSGETQESAE